MKWRKRNIWNGPAIGAQFANFFDVGSSDSERAGSGRVTAGVLTIEAVVSKRAGITAFRQAAASGSGSDSNTASPLRDGISLPETGGGRIVDNDIYPGHASGRCLIVVYETGSSTRIMAR